MTTTQTQSKIKKYLYNKKASGVRQETLSEYEAILNGFYEWLQKQDIQLIGKEEYIGYINHLVSLNRKASTIRLHSIVLKNFMGEIGLDTSKMALYKARTPDIRTIRQEDVDKMIESIKGDTEIAWRNRSILLLLSTSGIRASELCALDRRDITIKQSKGKKRVEVIIRNGKGDKVRVARTTTHTKDTIDIYLGARTDNSEALFVSHRGGGGSKSKGERLDRHSMGATVRKIAENVGLEGVSPHTLRHFCITELLRRGLSTSMVQKLAGHSSISITSRYTHFTDNDEWDAYGGVME